MSGSPIESYAVIGDCETAALVGIDGSVDWLCWPRFDSDSTFAALLGSTDSGRWLIAPAAGGPAAARRYRNGSLVLETDFETDEGAVRLIDFMPPRGDNSDFVRIVEGLRGRVKMRFELSIRFGYGHIDPWLRRLDPADETSLAALAGPDMVVLHGPVPVALSEARIVAEFVVGDGERVPFLLTYGPSHRPLPAPIDPEKALRETEAFWSEWSGRCAWPSGTEDDADGDISRAVRRSLVVLKALTFRPTGGLVAAATTSLPEWIGGSRNWDYRFCWLRDATLTLITLMRAGYYDEAEHWRDWLLRAVAGSPDQLQIMYGVAGERRLTEMEIPWLPGYCGSLPVRIGNAAHGQVQHDVYGEVMDALFKAHEGGLPDNPAAWDLQVALLHHLESDWREPDSGLWEVRGRKRHFTYSKALSWVAFDRGIRATEEFGFEGPVDRWTRIRDDIRADILARGYDPTRSTFVQAYGLEALDASLLLLPSLGFIEASDPRYVGTVRAIERELVVDGFVRRYDPAMSDDGFAEAEGAFLACSFWLVDAYAMTGRIDEAWALFRRLLSIRNDVGLLAEQYDPLARRQLGNFPQAFSHIALVNTAFHLVRATTEQERRPDPKAG